MEHETDLLTNMTLELRRGALILGVLSQLKDSRYGYALVQSLNSAGITIDPNTLYPLLRRLEKQGVLRSEWEMSGAKPRKYYSRTAFGDKIYRELKQQWHQLSANVNSLLEDEI